MKGWGGDKGDQRSLLAPCQIFQKWNFTELKIS